MATAHTVQLCFGLLASNKQPITCNINSVEDKVLHIAKRGTATDAYMQNLVYDSYEVLPPVGSLRAFLDLDIKRYTDKRPVPSIEGVVIVEQLFKKMGRNTFSTSSISFSHFCSLT
jgi:hypothetical protein